MDHIYSSIIVKFDYSPFKCSYFTLFKLSQIDELIIIYKIYYFFANRVIEIGDNVLLNCFIISQLNINIIDYVDTYGLFASTDS